MLQKVLGALGWLGTALVVAALVVRFTLPAQQDLWWWLSVAGLVMVAAYTVGQWRDIVTVFRRRHARYGTLAATSVLLGVAIPRRRELRADAPKQTMGSDGGPAVLAV